MDLEKAGFNNHLIPCTAPSFSCLNNVRDLGTLGRGASHLPTAFHVGSVLLEATGTVLLHQKSDRTTPDRVLISLLFGLSPLMLLDCSVHLCFLFPRAVYGMA